MPVIDPSSDSLTPFSSSHEPQCSPPLVNGDHIAVAGPGPSSRFSRYLSSLSVKPSQDPLPAFLDPELGTILDISFIARRRSGPNNLNTTASTVSLASMAGGNTNGNGADSANPEADSYAYMESLLEALAVLGRLGSALDTVAQRVPGEIHALVETTLDEVEDR